MLMLRYFLKRLIWVIPVMLGVLVVVFSITYFTPGDPVLYRLGSSEYTQERYDEVQKEMGLDKPFLEQLGRYALNLVTKFEMGKSLATNLSVTSEIVVRFPITLKLGLLSVFITLIIGLPLGILSAIKQYSAIDTSLTGLALILAAIPNYVLALLLIIVFGVNLKWLPITGLGTIGSWIMPITANSLAGIAVVTRMTRTTMLEIIRQDFIRTARAKGQKERIVLQRHALKNCLIPIVTSVSGSVAHVMAGSIIVETIFAIPGMGLFLLSGITSRDYAVINGCVILLSFIICIINLIVDIVYALIDPRIKAQYASRKKKNKAMQESMPEDAEVA